MLEVQVALFHQLCQLKKSVMPNIILRCFGLDMLVLSVGPRRRLSLLPDDSLHLHGLQKTIADAWGPLLCADELGDMSMQVATLDMAFPCISSGIGAHDSHGQNA